MAFYVMTGQQNLSQPNIGSKQAATQPNVRPTQEIPTPDAWQEVQGYKVLVIPAKEYAPDYNDLRNFEWQWSPDS